MSHYYHLAIATVASCSIYVCIYTCASVGDKRHDKRGAQPPIHSRVSLAVFWPVTYNHRTDFKATSKLYL